MCMHNVNMYSYSFGTQLWLELHNKSPTGYKTKNFKPEWISQSKFEANQPISSWVMIGHPNKQSFQLYIYKDIYTLLCCLFDCLCLINVRNAGSVWVLTLIRPNLHEEFHTIPGKVCGWVDGKNWKNKRNRIFSNPR